jgi:hypothetical protein
MSVSNCKKTCSLEPVDLGLGSRQGNPFNFNGYVHSSGLYKITGAPSFNAIHFVNKVSIHLGFRAFLKDNGTGEIIKSDNLTLSLNLSDCSDANLLTECFRALLSKGTYSDNEAYTWSVNINEARKFQLVPPFGYKCMLFTYLPTSPVATVYGIADQIHTRSMSSYYGDYINCEIQSHVRLSLIVNVCDKTVYQHEMSVIDSKLVIDSSPISSEYFSLPNEMHVVFKLGKDILCADTSVGGVILLNSERINLPQPALF